MKTGLSQAQFAALVGLKHAAYAGFEYDRTQLNYHAAWKILGFFWNLNPIWLAEGTGKMLEPRDFTFPRPEQCGAGQRALFSRVFEDSLRPRLLKAKVLTIVNPGFPVRCFPFGATALGILNNKERFGELLSAWLAELPGSKVAEFLDELFLRGAQIYARYPRDKDKRAVEKRKDKMYQIEKERRFPTSGLAVENPDLTNPATSAKHLEVKLQLPNLLDRLNRATKETGKMSALADFLGVPLASVSRWLAGKREPGGEITLKLLRWVEQQERQK